MKRFLNIKWIAAALVILLLVSGSREALASSSGSIATSLGGVDFSSVLSRLALDESSSVITLPDAEARIGEIVSVPLILTQAPDGLAGFLMEFSLADVSVGSIVSVEFPEYGLTYEAVTDGSQVRFAAADLFQIFEAGATDSTLAFVNIQGMTEGSTALQLGVVQMDDDNGDPITPQVFDGTFTTF